MRAFGRSWVQAFAFVASTALIIGACSGGSEPSTGGGGGTDTQKPLSERWAEIFDFEEGDLRDNGEPVYGGRLVYAVESDTGSPWTPQASLCAISCHMIMRSVFDPLMLTTDEGVEPFLAESMEPNDDFTVWTITAREGISFHDGTPFDGEAIKVNIEGHKASPLTGTIIRHLSAIEADGQTATLTFDKPQAQIADTLTGQLGYMASPTWLAATKEDSAKSLEPVGTGPFKFKSYEPGAQMVYVGERNAEYWMDGLPYLDEVEYRAIPPEADRTEAVISGDIDITHNSTGNTIRDLRGSDPEELVVLESVRFGETSYTMLHVGDDDSPLSDVGVRRALMQSVDREILQEDRAGGITLPANGFFNPSQIGFLDDTGFPEYDLEAATAFVEEYEAANGDLVLELNKTTDPFNAGTIDNIAAQAAEAGIEITTKDIPQDAFILQAALGNFQGFLWRNHAHSNPGAQEQWFHTEVADNPGISINFGRVRDEVVDAAFDKINSTRDPAIVKEQAEIINRRFGEQAYMLWGWWTPWSIIAKPEVKNITNLVLPSGNSVTPFALGIGGTHQIAQIWKAP